MRRSVLRAPSGQVLAILEPVLWINYDVFLLLVEEVQPILEKGGTEEIGVSIILRDAAPLIHKIISLVPSKGFVVSPYELKAIEFLAMLNAIAEISKIQPSAYKKEKTETHILEAEGGIPSTGDWEADLLADLINMVGVQGAFQLRAECDINTALRIADRYRLLNDPEELKRIKRAAEEQKALSLMKKWMGNPLISGGIDKKEES